MERESRIKNIGKLSSTGKYMKGRSRSPVLTYGIVVACVVLATGVRLSLQPYFEDQLPFGTYFVVVFFAAWYGGLGPCLASVVLSSLAALSYFVPPADSLLPIDAAGWIGLWLFLFIGCMTALFSEWMHKAAEQALSERERFVITLSSIGDAVIVTDTDARITFMNPVAEQLTGWKQDEAIGKSLETVFRIINEHTREFADSPVNRVLREGTIVGLANHTILIAKDGAEMAIDDSAAPIRERQKKTIGVVLVFRDVSEERRAQFDRSRLAALVDSSNDAILGQTLDGICTSWNAGAAKLFGYTAEETVGKPLSRTIIPADRIEESFRALAAIKNGQMPVPLESVRRHKYGRQIPVSIQFSAIRDADGNISGASAIDRDISEQKQIELRRNIRLAVTQILAEETDVDRAVLGILRTVGSNLEWDFGGYWARDADNEVLRCGHIWQLGSRRTEEFEQATRERTFKKGSSLPGRVWKSGRPNWVPDVTRDKEFHRAKQAAASGLHGAFGCPVSVGDDFLGVIEFFSHGMSEPDAGLLEMMGTLASQLGHFIKNARAEEQLRRSEKELADFFEHAAVGLHWVGPDGRILRANQAEFELLGYSSDEYIGRHIAEFHADPNVIDDILRRLKAGEELRNYEAQLVCKDGTLKDVLIDTNGYWENGAFVHSRCFTRDVTESKRAEQARAAIERRFQTLSTNAPLAIFIKDMEGRYTLANPLACEALGHPDGVTGMTDHELLPAEIADVLRRNDMQVLSTGRAIKCEEVVRRDGYDREYLAVKFPLIGGDGQPEGVCGMAVDITARKMAENALRDSEERLRLALTAGHLGTWEWNIRDNHVAWSPNLEIIHGLEPGSFPGTFEGYQRDIHPEDRGTVLAAIARAVENKADHYLEYRIIWPDKSVHWLETRAKLFCDDDGQPIRMLGVCADITDRKQTEAKLRFLAEASRSLSTLVDYKSTLQKVASLAVPDFADWCAVDLVSEDGTIERLAVAHIDRTRVRLADELYRRYPPDPQSDRGTYHVLRTGASELVSEISEEMLKEAAQSEEHLQIIRDIGLKSYMGVPLMGHGRAIGVLTFVFAESGRSYTEDDLNVAQDLAHRATVAIENARLYQEIRDADRRKDEFLAMLAHELRNPMAPIRSGLDLLAMEGDGKAETVQLMQHQVEHLVRLVDDLLDVSRIMRGRIELRKEPVNLADIVRQATEAVRNSMDEQRQQLIIELPDKEIFLQADRVRLVQVVENLLNNASKYTDSGKRIELDVETKGNEAIIIVRDEGIGIEATLLPKVFDLFTQSSRSLDRAKGGLGIGLTLVRNLVELHGGKVSAQSEGFGKGSEFRVQLPLGTAAAKSEPTTEPLAEAEGRRVLIVDDNVGAARMLELLLRKLGPHECELAHDGLTALAKMAAFQPDIVFLDIGLPGMDGYQIGKRIRENSEFDQTLVVALTGYGQAEDRRKSKKAGFDEHMVKPPAARDIRKLLAQRRKM